MDVALAGGGASEMGKTWPDTISTSVSVNIIHYLTIYRRDDRPDGLDGMPTRRRLFNRRGIIVGDYRSEIGYIIDAFSFINSNMASSVWFRC